MKNIEKLQKIFESATFREAALEYYERKERFLNDDCKDPSIFIPYLKAAIMDTYMNADEETKEELLEELSYEVIEPELDIDLIYTINTSVSSEGNKPIRDKDKEYLESLSEHIDDPIYEELSKHNKDIIKCIVRDNGFKFMRDIKPGKTFTSGRKTHTFDEEEIKTLERSKFVIPLLNRVHELYDEYEGELDKPRCNYDAIEDETLKKFAFHTDKENFEFEIIFDDGTIMNYCMGDIRFKPFNFKTVVKLTKLAFVELYRNDSQNDIERIFNSFNQSIDPYNMTEEEFDDSISASFEHIYKYLYCADEKESVKMLKDAKEDKIKMNKLILKYNLNKE